MNFWDLEVYGELRFLEEKKIPLINKEKEWKFVLFPCTVEHRLSGIVSITIILDNNFFPDNQTT